GGNPRRHHGLIRKNQPFAWSDANDTHVAVDRARPFVVRIAPNPLITAAPLREEPLWKKQQWTTSRFDPSHRMHHWVGANVCGSNRQIVILFGDGRALGP